MIFDSIDAKYFKQQLDKLSNLNITLSQLRDDLRGTGNKTLTDLDTDLSNIYGQLDVALSTRASESTLSGIKTQTDKLTFDGSNYLMVNVAAGSLTATVDKTKIWDGTDYLEINTDGSINVGNFPSWFSSSTKTTDDLYNKLDALDDALSSVGTDSFRAVLVDAIPAGDNWIGRVKLGDGTNLASIFAVTIGGSSGYGLATAPDLVKMLSGGTNYVYDEIATSTTESYSTYSPALKFAVLSNRDSTNDVLVRFNDPSPGSPSATQITIPAGTAKVIMFPLGTLNYVASAGTPTLVVNGFQ